MQADDIFWHAANFFAPAIVMSGLAAAIGCLVWRREWAGTTLLRLWLWAAAAAAVASVAGLLVFEHDGKMATYGAMVAASAAALWWEGFRRAKR